MSAAQPSKIHTLSVVIPVYSGEHTLPPLIAELEPYTRDTVTALAVPFRVTEVILVHDNGPDRSDVTMRELAKSHAFVRTVWLSRNFGQHAATLAGIASTSGDWVVTMDEDGQQNPAEIPALLDAAISKRAQVVYGKPSNPPPHGVLRNAASQAAKAIVNKLLSTPNATDFNSYRLILGSVARGVAAYSGHGVYLDIALGWIAGDCITAPVTLRSETRESGYSLRRLLGHFLRLVISSGTRGLRLVSILGISFGVAGALVAAWLVFAKLTAGIDAPGWTSLMVILLITSGATLLSLGIVAEYIGVSVNMAMGKPPYVITSDPADGPLGYETAAQREAARAA